jgi:hypothetical protein
MTDFEIDENAPRAGLVEMCLEDQLENLTEAAHLMSRSMGGSQAVPRIYTFTSPDRRKWAPVDVDAGLPELVKGGIETLVERLKEPFMDASHTVRVWLSTAAPDGTGPGARPSRKYILVAGSSEGAGRYMLYLDADWIVSEPIEGFASTFRDFTPARSMETNEGSFEEAVKLVKDALQVATSPECSQEQRDLLADKLVEALLQVPGRYLHALTMQADNLVALTSKDSEKALSKEMGDLERSARAAEKARDTLQKDFDKVRALNDSLLEQRTRWESEVKALRVAVHTAAGTQHFRGKDVAACLDELF